MVRAAGILAYRRWRAERQRRRKHEAGSPSPHFVLPTERFIALIGEGD
jgi:hypothetical protein